MELMERAGRGVVEAILDWRPELAKTSRRAVVLCGPGNNGGDGFVVARLLKQRGWDVEVFLYGDEAKLPPDAAENARRWRELGEVRVAYKNSIPSLDVDPSGKDLIIDALFGTGFTRPLETDLEQFLSTLSFQVPFSFMHWIAIDLPSGLCSDSGRVLTSSESTRSYKPADLTVTFHLPKLGHYLCDAPIRSGQIVLIDIGLKAMGQRALLFEAQQGLRSFGERWATGEDMFSGDANISEEELGKLAEKALDLLASPLTKEMFYNDGEVSLIADCTGDLSKSPNSSGHKYSHGHALILSSGPGKGGAARLAARGALRIGAGLVTVGCPPEALAENAARLDAVMLATVKGVEGLQTELRDRKINAVCIGPGFGLGQRLRDFVEAALMSGVELRPSVVLDADALTEYRDDPETLFAMLHDHCVLTPHEGEFGRLFPDILAKLKEPATKGPAYSKVDATREAAKRAGCAVLYKGPDTVIAHPDGRCAINSAHYDRAAPWLATAGSGDVLAGFITGLLARGLDPMTAAETAAWLHVECALKFGPGLIAEDLPEQLPAVFRELSL